MERTEYNFGVIYDREGIKNYKLFGYKKDAEQFLFEQLSVGIWAVLWKKEDGPKIYLIKK